MTTIAAARELGCSRRTIQKWAAVQGWTREGRDYYIDTYRLGVLRRLVQRGPGNPNWRRAP